jgi:hypothetical protein
MGDLGNPSFRCFSRIELEAADGTGRELLHELFNAAAAARFGVAWD